jgi:hypothetical protein
VAGGGGAHGIRRILLEDGFVQLRRLVIPTGRLMEHRLERAHALAVAESPLEDCEAARGHVHVAQVERGEVDLLMDAVCYGI